MPCANCGFDNPPCMKYCGRCGTPLADGCPSCGAANPPDFIYCGQCGALLPELVRRSTLLPRPEERFSELQGERRVATIILADVTGSTALLERMGTEAWVAVMNRLFQILESEIYRYGGVIDQFRGDGLVAFFGTTGAHEDDPERAVLAGLAMQAAVKPYATELAEREGLELSLRVGINTGEVIVASVGNRHYSEETAMGEAIALAARLETAAEPGTVLVSESTYQLSRASFDWQPLGSITLKGLSQPVAVYRPLAHHEAGAREQDAGRPDLPLLLVGREAELQLLVRTAEDLYAGRGSIVLLAGEKGVGKSRLAEELRHHLSRNEALLADAGATSRAARPILWLRTRGRSYEQASPYSMWRVLLYRWLGARESDAISFERSGVGTEPESREQLRDRLRSRAQQLWGDGWADFYAYLAALMRLPLEAELDGRVQQLDAEALGQQFTRTIKGWIEAMMAAGPLILMLNDAHWADVTSLEVLERCLPLCEKGPVLFLLLYRHEPGSTLAAYEERIEKNYPHRAVTISIGPLSKEESLTLINRLIGADALSTEVRRFILHQSEGNPYYIEEYIRTLIDQGILVHDESSGKWWTTRDVTAVELPDSLQALLLARLDRLRPEERRTLQMASVIGPVFWTRTLQALETTGDGRLTTEARSGSSESAKEQGSTVNGRLEAHLAALQRAGLIYERDKLPELGTEYGFHSSLIRDTAYESLLTTQRLTYHGQAAACLEDLYGSETLTPHLGLLAYHYRQAGERGKELFYTLEAAEEARRLYAQAEALRHYNRALELIDELAAETDSPQRLYILHSQRFEVLNGRRDIYFRMGRFEEGHADALSLLPLAQELGDDPTWLVDALLRQPGVDYWRSQDELVSGLHKAEEALAAARRLGDRRREMESLLQIANQRLALNEPEGTARAEEALALARKLGDQVYETAILIRLGAFYNWVDQPERGQSYLEAALPIARASGDRRTELDLLHLLAFQPEREGDYYRLLTEYNERRVAISREIGFRISEANALLFSAQVRAIYLGDYEAGMEELNESLRIMEGITVNFFALLRIVQIRTMQGRLDEAKAALEEACSQEANVSYSMGVAGLALVSAIYNIAVGDETHLRQALDQTDHTRSLADSPMLSSQYAMGAAALTAEAHLKLSNQYSVIGNQYSVEDNSSTEHRASNIDHRSLGLAASQEALALYEQLGFVQIIECTSEQVLFVHSQALAANGREAEAADYRQRAYDEMMRKHALIPPDSHFRQTYLENIPLHRAIRAAIE